MAITPSVFLFRSDETNAQDDRPLARFNIPPHAHTFAAASTSNQNIAAVTTDLPTPKSPAEPRHGHPPTGTYLSRWPTSVLEEQVKAAHISEASSSGNVGLAG